MARYFDLAAVAGLSAAVGCDVACHGGGGFGPDHHTAAVALSGGACRDEAWTCYDGGRGVKDFAVVALPAAADADASAAGSAVGM